MTATNEYSSHHDDNAKVEAPIKKRKDKGSKLVKNRTLKKDQRENIKPESIFMKNEWVFFTCNFSYNLMWLTKNLTFINSLFLLTNLNILTLKFQF